MLMFSLGICTPFLTKQTVVSSSARLSQSSNKSAETCLLEGTGQEYHEMVSTGEKLPETPRPNFNVGVGGWEGGILGWSKLKVPCPGQSSFFLGGGGVFWAQNRGVIWNF